MKLQVVLCLVILAGYVQTSYSCCRRDDQPHRCTLREKIGIIRAALRQASCDRVTACPLTAENICDCNKEPVCPTKPNQCAPESPCKVPACQTRPACQIRPSCSTIPPCRTVPPCRTIPPCSSSNPAKPCGCNDRTPVCPLIPNKPCDCQQAPGCSVTQKPCVGNPVCPTVPGNTCGCQNVPAKPCVDKAPLCVPIPINVPQCQEKTPVCPSHVDKPCDCHVKPPVCPAVTEKSCNPCQTVTEKHPCHCPQPCSHHMVIPIANVSNIFANSMFLGIPCKPHHSHCDTPVKNECGKPTTKTTTTTTTCAPPEPNCYVCIQCKGKQCTEVINKIKLYVTGGKEPCMVCDE